jgi:hypothetical protein
MAHITHPTTAAAAVAHTTTHPHAHRVIPTRSSHPGRVYRQVMTEFAQSARSASGKMAPDGVTVSLRVL